MKINGYIPAGNKFADGYEHIRVVEAIIGKSLPEGVIVHHVDGDKTNNSPSNLVVCQDSRYHNMLHYRDRALTATGDADAVYCRYCKTWETDRSKVKIRYIGKHKNTIFPAHVECVRQYDRLRWARKKNN